MEPFRPVTLSAPVPSTDLPLRPIAPVAGADAPTRQMLDPAVSVELSRDAASGAVRDGAEPEPRRRGFERDAETQTLVYRVTDAFSGDVIVQIPDEIVLKARAYARQPSLPAGERIAKTA